MAAFVVLLKVDPATQAVQALFTVVEHAVETRVPGEQTVHAVQLTAFVVGTGFFITQECVQASRKSSRLDIRFFKTAFANFDGQLGLIHGVPAPIFAGIGHKQVECIGAAVNDGHAVEYGL